MADQKTCDTASCYGAIGNETCAQDAQFIDEKAVGWLEKHHGHAKDGDHVSGEHWAVSVGRTENRQVCHDWLGDDGDKQNAEEHEVIGFAAECVLEQDAGLFDVHGFAVVVIVSEREKAFFFRFVADQKEADRAQSEDQSGFH